MFLLAWILIGEYDEAVNECVVNIDANNFEESHDALMLGCRLLSFHWWFF